MATDLGVSPLEIERNELGYNLQVVRLERRLRVIHKPCAESDVCIFFVHGGGGRAGQFKHQIKILENLVNIVAFDFLGHGDSPRVHDSALYTADEHLEDLIAIFNKYQQHKNVYVSHSYGNIHVLRHLKLLESKGKLDLIAGVVMIGLGVNHPVSLGLAGKLPSFVLEWLRPFARSAANASIFTPETDPELIKSENTISNHNRMFTMKTIGRDCSNQDTWTHWLENGRQALVGNNIPRAIITGDKDGVFPLESATKLKQLMEVSDECFHVIQEVGHLPMLERSEDVNGFIMNFLCCDGGVLECIPRSDSVGSIK